MLGIRSTVKEDIDCTPADLLYGTALKLPGQIFDPVHTPAAAEDHTSFVHRLRRHMADIPPVLTRRQNTTVHVPRTLLTSSHVFVRVDAIAKPLQAPYTGPYAVVKRHAKCFELILQ